MTRHGASLLVRGPLPPLPESRLQLSPGCGAAFDGDRWHASLTVVDTTGGRSVRRSFDHREVRDALAAVTESARRRDPGIVVLDGRDRLGELFSARTLDRIETELACAARRADAPFVARTGAKPPAEVQDRYAVVIDAGDERTWRGEPGDPPRRRCSRSRDTAPGRTISEP